MEISLYQIDAFASELFEGNPAAVCPLDEWLPDETMQSIAAENNLSAPEADCKHRTSNIEHRIMYSVYFKKTEQGDSTLRHSIFDILRFCGSLLM